MMKFNLLQWSLTLLLLFGARLSLAGALTAEIDQTQSSLDEPFWLTVSIQGSLDGDLQIPDTHDFEFTRTGESTNISIINGSITKERQLTYQVRALKEGQLTIPSLKAKVDGKDVQTVPIAVEVKGGVAPPTSKDVADNKKLVFVEREMPKKTFYEGEAVISTVRLLTRARLAGATPSRDAAPDWRLIAVEGQRNTELMREGVRWSAIEMREGLIPLKPGKLKVPAFGITATWLQPSTKKQRRAPGNIFDLFQQGVFNMGEEVTRKLLSEATEVDVKALPAPKPSAFADIVGAFTLVSSVSSREIAAGETVTLTITIKGQGALDRMREMKLAVPGAKIYADRPSLSEKIEPAAGLVSTRVLKYAVVPENAGTIDLGTVKVASFNSFTDQYEDLTANLGQIKVTGSPVSGTPQPTKAVVDDGPKDVSDRDQAPASMVLEPKEVSSSSEESTSWWLAPWALAMEFLIAASVVAWVLLRKQLRRLSPTQTPLVTPKQNWNEILVGLDQGDTRVLEEAIDRLRAEFAVEGQDPKALTSREILLNAEKRGVEANVLDALKRALSEIDRREYGLDNAAPLPETLVSDVRRVILFCQSRS